MPNTAIHAKHDRLREEIERLASLRDVGIPQAFLHAMQSLLTARDYDDPILMRSHLDAAFEALREAIREAVEERLSLPQEVMAVCRKVRDLLKGCVDENFDEVGRTMESHLAKMLKILTDLKDGPVQWLQQHDYEVENAARLNGAIEELQALTRGVLADWPWSDRELPPVDWDMVDASREARQRGEGEPIEDLIRRLGGELPTRG